MRRRSVVVWCSIETYVRVGVVRACEEYMYERARVWRVRTRTEHMRCVTRVRRSWVIRAVVACGVRVRSARSRTVREP